MTALDLDSIRPRPDGPSMHQILTWVRYGFPEDMSLMEIRALLESVTSPRLDSPRWEDDRG